MNIYLYSNMKNCTRLTKDEIEHKIQSYSRDNFHKTDSSNLGCARCNEDIYIIGYNVNNVEVSNGYAKTMHDMIYRK